jgi:hypothetical protein
MTPSMIRRERRWLPTLVVMGIIVTTVLGGFVVAAALSEPAGPAVTVGDVVQVQPLSGWESPGTTTTGGLPFARLTRGGGNLDVVAVPSFDGDARSLADRYVSDVLSKQLSGLSVSDDLRAVLLGGGEVGQRFDYVGVTDTGGSVEGEVTVVVGPSGSGVVFDGWASEGLLTFVSGDVHTMEERAVFA